MTANTAIVAALLAAALISIAWLWVKYVERNTHRTDDPLMQSKLWNQRKRLNQCIFCGQPLDGDFDPDRLLRDCVCSSCPKFELGARRPTRRSDRRT
jgi:hypothetical protein